MSCTGASEDSSACNLGTQRVEQTIVSAKYPELPLATFLGHSNPWDTLTEPLQQQPGQISSVAVKEPLLSAKITDPISWFSQRKATQLRVTAADSTALQAPGAAAALGLI